MGTSQDHYLDDVIALLQERNHQLAAKIKALREALAPFASISLLRDAYPDDERDCIEGPDLAITPNDVRRARTAIVGLAIETTKRRRDQTEAFDGGRLG